MAGHVDGGWQAWKDSGSEVAVMEEYNVHKLQEKLQSKEVAVLDVRTDNEWQAGHIEGAQHIMGGNLQSRLDELAKELPLVCVCGAGYRSLVCASILRQAGFSDVINLAGGMSAWNKEVLPVVSPS